MIILLRSAANWLQKLHLRTAAFRRATDGTVAVLMAVALPMVVGIAGFAVDVGMALSARKELEAGTQAAAMAGAQALGLSAATTVSVTAAVTQWTAGHQLRHATVTGTAVRLACDTATSGLPSCSTSAPNIVSVTQSASIPTFFLKAFGRTTFAISAAAKAAKAGGGTRPLNVMFVLDATGSMSSIDSSCTVPGLSRPTRFQCALYSIQSVLKVMPASIDKTGLMIFPGMGTQYAPVSHPCPTQPNSLPYLSSGIKYQVGTTLDDSYNNGAGSLMTASPMIQAVGYYPTLSPCVTNKGGQGSYAAEILGKAKAALTLVPGTQNVIILLSDGDYNASLSQLNNRSDKLSQQCRQAVDAANAATSSGTLVYAVAYNAPLSGCSSGDVHTPCTALQAIASDASRFYTTNANCNIGGSANPVTQLPQIFQAIAVTLTKPRLLAN